jgi:general secretion pathway protein N
MKKLLAFLLVVCVFITSVVYHLPASWLVKHVSIPRNVQLGQVQGSLFEGNSESVIVNGITLGSVNWHWNLQALFSGRWQYQLSLGQISGPIRGSARLSLLPTGTIELEQGRFTMQAEWFSPLLSLPVQPELMGALSVRFPSLTITPQGCQSGHFLADWNNAGVSTLGQHVDLGSVAASGRCNNTQLTLDAKQESSMLSSEANVNLSPNARGSVDGWLIPEEQFPSQLDSMLRWLPQDKASGRYTFRQSFRL